MKHRILLPIALAALLLTGCSGSPSTPAGEGSGGSSSASATPAEPTTPAAEPTPPAADLDLTGEWKQTNSDSATSYQTATIAGDVITVNWVNEAESTTALYWIGTYEAPTEATDTFTWTSVGDVEKMDPALLASGDESKVFTYEDGTLKYELTAMSVTMTVEMAKQ